MFCYTCQLVHCSNSQKERISTVMWTCAAIFAFIVSVASAWWLPNPPNLESYGADPTRVSVSGVSSGAAMAVQLHVAYSSSIMGVGAVAGVPYNCLGEFSMIQCVNVWPTANMQTLQQMTEDFASDNKIDATTNMVSARVYLFSGTLDAVVPKATVRKLEEYYEGFITNTNSFKTVYNKPAGHGFITDDYGVLCGMTFTPFINDCNYNMAYELLNHIYENLVAPDSNTDASGQLLTFNQEKFFPSSGLDYMADKGYIYVPTGCASSQSNCKLHVALHGCSQPASIIGNKFYTKTGFNEVGELNDIIIVYPQSKVLLLSNPAGCWDWFGFSGANYATKDGWQMKVIKGMIDRILA